MSRFPRIGPLAVALIAALSPLAQGHAQPARATEEIVLVVEVLDRDPRPVIPCGTLGAQPRDVTARVLSVERGSFSGERVLLSWPMCEFSQVAPGEHYRIRIRRWADVAPSSDTRYRVRRSEHIEPAPTP